MPFIVEYIEQHEAKIEGYSCLQVSGGDLSMTLPKNVPMAVAGEPSIAKSEINFVDSWELHDVRDYKEFQGITKTIYDLVS